MFAFVLFHTPFCLSKDIAYPLYCTPSCTGNAMPPTREQKTKEDYLSRISSMINTMSNTLGRKPTIMEITTEIIARKTNWTRSTWRQYKASAIYYFELEGSNDALFAIEILRAETESDCLKRSERTSGKRAKNPSREDLYRLLEAIRHKKSQYKEILISWIHLGGITGLRPHEWCQAEVVEHANAETVEPGPFLRVKNSKNSNGRAHGDYRHLAGLHELEAHAPGMTELIIGFIAKMKQYNANGTFAAMTNSCRKLLRKCNTEVFGADGPWIQIYTARHIYSSNAKNLHSRTEVAAAMGHSTDRTAGVHYGKRRYGGSGSVILHPVQDEVKRVKQKVTAFTPASKNEF